MGMKVKELRTALQAKQSDGWSLRKIGDATGVSFSTLSRFARGKEMASANCERLAAWIEGRDLQPRPEVHSRRLRVGGKTFLLTLELID